MVTVLVLPTKQWSAIIAFDSVRVSIFLSLLRGMSRSGTPSVVLSLCVTSRFVLTLRWGAAIKICVS